MVLITIVTGANLNQLITGGGHIVEMVGFSTSMLVCVSWEQKAKHGAGTNIKNHQDRTGI